MGSEGGVLGPHHGLWVVGGGGGRSLPFMVVGTQCVFIVLVYCSWVHTTVHGGGCSTCLHCSFPSMTWLPTSRGGVTWRVLAANHQWAVDGGGAVLVGWVVIDMVQLLTISVVPHQSALHGYHITFSNVAQLTHGVIGGSGAMECSFRGCWSSSAGCCLCYMWLLLLLGGHGHLLGSCCHLLGSGSCLLGSSQGIRKYPNVLFSRINFIDCFMNFCV